MKVQDILEEMLPLDPNTEVILFMGEGPTKRKLEVKAILPFVEHGQVIIRLG